MSVINKELYDALLEAKVSDEKATAAAKSDLSVKEDISDLKARFAMQEKLLWGVLLGILGLFIKSFTG